MPLVSPKKASKYFEEKLEFTLGPVELKDKMQREEDINIIDVRAPEDFEKGHIVGAVNVPKGHWDEFEGLSRDKLNIVYCYSEVCHLAAAAAYHFAERGFPVMELEGGIEEWKRHELPVEM